MIFTPESEQFVREVYPNKSINLHQIEPIEMEYELEKRKMTKQHKHIIAS